MTSQQMRAAADFGAADEYRFPLSYQQSRLWFLEQLAPGDPAYHMPIALGLHGQLDITALDGAFEEIVGRHEMLRTAFAVEGGEPAQAVTPSAPVLLTVADLSGLAEPQRLLRGLATQVIVSPFDLRRPPLLRAVLARLGPLEHMLIAAVHHIICDGWSVGVLASELSAAYAALRQGREPALPELAVQYGDFALWQRDWLSGESLGKVLRHWERALAGAPAVLDLPTDRPRLCTATSHGAHFRQLTGAGLADRVAVLTSEHGVSLFMVVLAAYAAVLSRYAGQDDVVIGTPVAGRPRPELGPLIGCFIDMLPLRVDLSGNPTAAELLDRVRAVCLDAYAHAELPFERLVEHLQPDRDLPRTPVFQVMLALQDAPKGTLDLPGLRAVELSVDHGAAKYELTLNAESRGSDVLLDLEYNSDLFEAGTVARLGEHLAGALTWLVAGSGERLSAAGLVPAGERAWLARAGTGPAAADGRDLAAADGPDLAATDAGLVPQVLTRRAAASGGTAAVRGGDGQQVLTYAGLIAAARSVAAGLAAAGVRRGDVVGVLLPRSPAAAAALTGVWLAGAAFLPLDPELPAARLQYMIADTAAPVILTCADLADQAHGPQRLLTEDLPPAPDFTPVPISAADRAYILYTSGSTGQPRAVAVSHGGLANLLRAVTSRPGLTPADRLLAVTTFSFDMGLLELFAPLLAGGQTIIATPEQARDPHLLAQLIDTTAATIMQATPATWRMLTAAGWQPARPLRIISGGEALTPALTSTLLAAGHELWNGYGPTETTIYSTIAQITDPAAITIGTPLPGTRIQILDPRLQPVPAGAAGEIYISGTGLAHGYLGQPAHTAQKFLPDPTGHSQRMYRTGDLGRWNNHGQLRYLGRADRQLKIRGYRVEPGEIETALTRHPAITDAIVTAPHGTLTAHIIPAAPATAAQLRDHLRTTLPAYMIPAHIITLDHIPLTPTGKINHAALPPPEPQTTPPARTPTSQPSDPQHQADQGADLVLQCFRLALGKPALRMTDDFFANGGSSLMAVRLVADIERELGSRLRLRELFRAATPAGALALLRGSAAQLSAMPLAQDGRLDPSIIPAPPHHSAWSPAHVLLTGGTGFLGSALLEQLLATPGVRVSCLVRADTDGAAAARLRQSVARYCPDLDLSGRVTALRGNVTTEQLGLDRGQYAALAQDVCAIYHCAAEVSFAAPYPALRAANVTGTAELIRFAATTAGKALHFVSTLGLATAGDIVREQVGPVPAAGASGYAESKHAAELLVTEAGRRGLPVTILRPWVVTAHRASGAMGESDQLALLLHAALQTSILPDLPDLPVHIMPADQVAGVMADLGRCPAAAGRVIHLFNPRLARLAEVADLLTALGHPIRLVPVGDWADAMARADLPASARLLARLLAESRVRSLPPIEIAAAASLLGHPIEFSGLTASYLERAAAHVLHRASHGGIS